CRVARCRGGRYRAGRGRAGRASRPGGGQKRDEDGGQCRPERGEGAEPAGPTDRPAPGAPASTPVGAHAPDGRACAPTPTLIPTRAQVPPSARGVTGGTLRGGPGDVKDGAARRLAAETALGVGPGGRPVEPEEGGTEHRRRVQPAEHGPGSHRDDAGGHPVHEAGMLAVEQAAPEHHLDLVPGPPVPAAPALPTALAAPL